MICFEQDADSVILEAPAHLANALLGVGVAHIMVLLESLFQRRNNLAHPDEKEVQPASSNCHDDSPQAALDLFVLSQCPLALRSL